MSNPIKITITGDDAQMAALLARQNAMILNNELALQKFAAAGEKAGNAVAGGADAGTAAFGRLAGAITGIGGIVGGVTGVVGVLKREWEDLVQRQKKAADIQISLADAQTQQLGNLGTDKEVDAKRLMQLNRQGAKATGMTERDFTLAFSDALSARGDKSAMEAHRATVAAGSLLPNNPEAAKLLSGATLDVAKRTGMSSEAAVGALISMGRAARVTGMQGTAEHLAPGALGAMDFGDSWKQASGLISAISLGENDPTGRRSRTATISLAKQLEERYPDLPNTQERIRHVQAGGEKEWKKFFEGGKYKVGGKNKKFEGASFEATFLATARGLLRADSQQAKEYDAAVENSASPAEAAQVHADLMRDKEALPSVQLSRKQRFYQGRAEAKRIDNTKGASESVTREGIEETLESMDEPWLLRKIIGAKAAIRIGLKEDENQVAADVYRGRAADIRSGARETGQLSPEREADAAEYESLAKGLEELIRLQKERIEQADKQHADRPKNEPVPLAGVGALNQR